MAGTSKFHSKFHRANHHSVISPGIPDSGLDTIASITQPFLGIFYNTITDDNRSYTLNGNSLQWYMTYTVVSQNSGYWGLTDTVYKTVNTLSAFWNLGYDGYLSFYPNSAKYESAYTTLKTYSAGWNDENIMYLNVVQEYTKSKTFSGTDLTYLNINSVDWDLDLNQVTFITLMSSISVNNPLNMKRGGLYTMVVKQNAEGAHDISFDTCYRFNNNYFRYNIVYQEPNTVTVINFLCDGALMYGDVIKLSA
jgi:hypothetical protein